MIKISKYPFVKQQSEKDCAVACLLMIIKYYDGNIPYNIIYDMVGCNSNGTSAYNLVKIAREIGFECSGIKCHINNLKDINTPFVAHVLIDKKFYHYVVIYKVDLKHNKIVVADPASTVYTLSIDEFTSIFNNIVITMFPKEKLPYYKKHDVMLKYALEYIKIYKSKILGYIVIYFISLIISILTSFMMLTLIKNQGLTIYKSYVVFLILLFLLQNVLIFIKNKIILNAKVSIDKKITLDTFNKILFLPYKTYCSRTTGEFISRISDAKSAGDTIATYIFNFLIDILIITFTLIILFNISIIFSLIFIIIYFLYFLIYSYLDKDYARIITLYKKKNCDVNHKLFEAIEGYESVKGSNLEEYIKSDVESSYAEYSNLIKKLENRENIQNIFCNLFDDFISLFICLYGFNLVKNNLFSLNSFFIFFSLISYVKPQFRNLIYFMHDKKELREILDRIHDFCEYQTNKINSTNVNKIDIDNLSVDMDIYKTPVINTSINKYDKILIYGKSGVGKSTMFKAIKGYLNKYSGNIKFNGKLKEEEIMGKIIYLSQQEILFTKTIRENICMNKKINSDKLNEILELTKVTDILEKRKIGIDTLIEENGSNLSGGERQRIVLARAFLKDADVYLLDESFSEMDSSMERKILLNIFSKYQDKIIMVVSHRTDNKDIFDKVIKFPSTIKKEVKSYA